MSDNQLQVILKEQGLEKNEAHILIEAFGGPFKEAGEILADYKKIVVTDVSQKGSMLKARQKRLALKKARTTVEGKRKELKQDIIKQGRAIDNVARFVKDVIEPAEKYLLSQEKFAEIKAAEHAAKLKAERIEKLLKYYDDVSIYDFDSMSEEQFKTILATGKAERERLEMAQKEAEKKEIAEAKAKAEEDKRIRRENDKLKAEAEKKEAEREKERKAEADRQSKIDVAREKELEEERTKAEEERKKREALEAEQIAKEEAEAKLKAEADEAERKALLAPDKDKLVSFAKAIDTVRLDKLPAVKTQQAQDVVNTIELELSKLFNLIMNKAKEL